MKILESGYKIGLDFTLLINRACLGIAIESICRFVDGLDRLLMGALSMRLQIDGVLNRYCKRLRDLANRFEKKILKADFLRKI
jgi:hypothetical protein